MVQSGKSFLGPEKSAALLEQLHAKIVAGSLGSKGNKRIVNMLSSQSARWAAVAMIILCIGVVWRHINKEVTPVSEIAGKTGSQNRLVIQANNGTGVQKLLLPDHSLISLSPGSAISYYASFNSHNRNISLKGRAVFKVAKDSTRPFTVYGGDISTTVLGTTFMMNTLEQNKVHVKLFEGKVLIRFATKKLAVNEVRLHAGEYFIIDKKLDQFTVVPFKDKVSISSNKPISSLNDTTNVGFEFNQEPLANVLASIGKRYNVEFKFRQKGFNNMLVTGRFLPSDSLSVILTMLGNINGLSFKEHNKKIEVTTLP